MEPLRVTFCAYDKPDSVGGPLTWLVNLLPRLRAHGIEPRCLFLLHWGDSGPYIEAMAQHGIECDSTLCHPHSEDRVRWILGRLRENPPDVFVPNLVVAAYFCIPWLRESAIPSVGILHSDDEFYRTVQDEFVFGADEFRVDSLVVVSRELESQVRSKQPSCSVERIPYGVSVSTNERRRGNGPFRVAYVGRLAEEQKRISDVAVVMCRITERFEDTEALIYGDGPDRPAVEQVIAGHGAEERVLIKGLVSNDEIWNALQEIDCLLLLSDYEGLPIALLEAMAAGVVPVCMSMRSGVPELISHLETGLIVEDRDQSVLNAVDRLRQEPELWGRLSANARARVSGHFSFDRNAVAWANLLKSMARGSEAKEVQTPSSIRLPPQREVFRSADPRPDRPKHRTGYRSVINRAIDKVLRRR